MTAPNTTVFEVKVSNKLPNQHIFIKLQAELQYATHLTSSSKNWDAQKSYNKTADSNKMEDTKYDKDTHAQSYHSDNKSHIKSSAYSHQNSASSKKSATNVSAKANYGLASGNINVNRNNSSHTATSSSSHHSTDNEQRNILSTQKSGTKVSSSQQKRDNAESETVSKEYDKRNESYSSTMATNTVIEPGFVRIAPLQSISIPVIIAYESQVVYITVYIENKRGEKLFISNGLQINRQHIDIIRNAENEYIEIHPTTKSDEKHNKLLQFRVFLVKWGFPDYLCDAMQNAGWYDMRMWGKLTDKHLVEMGFKSGHRILLHEKYKKYLRTKQKINSDIDCGHLLRAWNLPNYIHENMVNNGWEDVELWSEINDADFKEMRYKQGHIRKFQKYVNKNNDHLKQFEKLRNDLKANKIFIESESDDDSDDDGKREYDNIRRFDLKIPEMPQFKIDSDKVLCHSFELELEAMRKNERYIIEIAENDGRWQGVGDLKKAKNRRIDGLKANSCYSVRIFAQNQHLMKSKYSQIVKIKTLNPPKCAELKLNDCKSVTFQLEKNSIQPIVGREDIKVVMQMGGMEKKENMDDDEKYGQQFADIVLIKKDEIIYKCDMNEIFYKYIDRKINIRFKITQNDYPEFTQNDAFLLRKCFVGNENNKIKLEYHSHSKHYDDRHPRNLLVTDGSSYWLQGYKNEKDWIIFKIQKNELYLPTKLVLKSSGNSSAVKRMQMFIGDGISKWYGFTVNNQSVINCAKTGEYQSFDISVNFEQIQKHSLKYIKLEFIEGWHDNCLAMKELRLHGIQMNI